MKRWRSAAFKHQRVTLYMYTTFLNVCFLTAVSNYMYVFDSRNQMNVQASEGETHGC